MGSEWVVQKISSLGEFDRGKSKHRPRDAKHLYGGSFPFIQTGDITNSNGRITTYRQTYNDAGLAQSRLWPVGTLAITIAANIAETALLTFPACFPDSVVGFTADPKKADIRFVEYLFQAMRKQVKSHAYGSVQENINLDVLRKLEFPIPTLDVQTAIADHLSVLDDRITLLRETNKTLEAIAQAIFKSWFIDFDPVRAKMEGRAPAGMDEETAALFPDELVESELGLIPKGWIIGDVNHFATFQNGYAFKSKDWSIMGFPAVKIGNVKPTFIDFSDCSMVSQETVNGLDRYKLERGDLLVGMTGYVGEVGLVTEIKKMPYLNQRVGKINPKHGFTRLPYVFCLCRHFGFKVYAESQSHGSAQANVSGIDLMKYKAIIPNELLLQKFNSTLINLIEKLLANQEETYTLKALRDTLLPRLISGKLKVTAFSI
jgi:type I restriction enzyme S subunit